MVASLAKNSREVGVKLSKDVLQQVEVLGFAATNGTQELEEGIIKEEILPAMGNDIAPRLEPIKRDLVLVVEYHPGEPISVGNGRGQLADIAALKPPACSVRSALPLSPSEATERIVQPNRRRDQNS